MDKKKKFGKVVIFVGGLIVIMLLVFVFVPNPVDEYFDKRFVEGLDPPEEFMARQVDSIHTESHGYYFNHNDYFWFSDDLLKTVVVHLCSGDEWVLEGTYSKYEIHHLIDWVFIYAPNKDCD